MRQLHFLHIGKCAGTYIKSLAGVINATRSDLRIIAHPHHVTLAHIPPGSDYFFSIRAPEARFLSGFYSRKRKGLPLYNSEWSPPERIAFGYFEHANDLAEALFTEGVAGGRAFAAMKSIEHLARDQTDYFRGLGFFLSHWPPVFIIRQENFEADMRGLYARLGLEGLPLQVVDPTTSKRARHGNDYSEVKPLSEAAIANLRRWYAQDVELIRQCNRWIAQAGKG